MVLSGERYSPEMHGNIELEHFHRYLFAGELVAGKRVLDIASGEGYGASILAVTAASVVGVDLSQEAVEHARSRYSNENLTFLAGSCQNIPIANGSVDIVVSFETIEHHDQHDLMMHEIKRVLAPKGILIISSPDKYRYSIDPDYHNPFHVKELFEDEFRQLVHTYFAKSEFLGQRIVYGSSLVADSGAHDSTFYWRDPATGLCESGGNRPLYWIALASDGNIPDVSCGLFEVPIDESETVAVLKKTLQEAWASMDQLKLTSDHTSLRLEAEVAKRELAERCQDDFRQRLNLKSAEIDNITEDYGRRLDDMQALLLDTRAREKVARLYEGESISMLVSQHAKIKELTRELQNFSQHRDREVPDGQSSTIRKTGERRRYLPSRLAGARPKARISEQQIGTDAPISALTIPSFDADEYLEMNLDVASEKGNPLEHYLAFGIGEGRAGRRSTLDQRDTAFNGHINVTRNLAEFMLPADSTAYRPLVSVIVPCFNHADYIRDRLESVYSQDYGGDFEVILLDDGSNDGSPEVLQEYHSKYSHKTVLDINPKNSGSAFQQWRHGLELVHGDLVWIAESDDLLRRRLVRARYGMEM